MDVDAIVIGAGVVGLACAHAMARRGASVLTIERHGRVGTETSSRNSGVIHAGIHGPIGSLKSDTCIQGRKRLYAWCEEHEVPYRHTGKLIVAANDAESESLEVLAQQAETKGLHIDRWDSAQLEREEPLLHGTSAIRVAESGVVDAHTFVQSVRRAAADEGALLALGQTVVDVQRERSLWRVSTATESLSARVVINAAGLAADAIAAMSGIDVDARGWRIHPFRGDYFRIDASGPKHALVYPMPGGGGLGIHLTRTLDGRLLAGPDANPGADLIVDEGKREVFTHAVQRYWRGAAGFHPDYAGVRPKLRADGSYADFVLHQEPEGFIHLIGIESPGLTASLELGDRVAELALA